MSKSPMDAATLLVAAIASALALMLLAAGFGELASIGGLILLLVLLAYDRDVYRSLFQSLAFSAVCGLCLTVACAAIYQRLAAHGEVHLANGNWSREWLPITCAFATAIFWAIDRARMSGRVAPDLPTVARRQEPATSFVPTSVPAPSAVPAEPTPTAPPLRSLTPEPAPSATMYGEAAPFTYKAAASASSPPEFNPVVPPEAAQKSSAEAVRQEPVAPNFPAETLPPQAIPAPRGKQTLIYVTLVGEGLNVLRSVNAEHLGRDYYRIVDTMPEGETWQFQPGQVVRCKKQNLSSGKALVAMEEAPRAT